MAPLSEMRWRLLVQALAHTGQRRKALIALADARDAFSTAGLDFGSELHDLERRVVDVATAENCAALARDFTFSTALCLAGDATYLSRHTDAAPTIYSALAPWSGLWAWMGTASLGPVDLDLGPPRGRHR